MGTCSVSTLKARAAQTVDCTRDTPVPHDLRSETGCPIVPTAIIGSDKLQPIGTSIPKKGKTKVLYGKPIEVAKKPADEITHDDLRSLTDRVSTAIQKMSGQEFVNEYAQKVKAELKAQQAAEEAEK